ncbi:MAG: type II toxin-antitoxin system VapC family toxin [Coleofasciculaceae cyanobacterium RL_1_1]|nr:type II toxin-antitoxin system VapC family toxin [Coleofasciculaceae cyanobacterium RL_1_1]
MTYQYMLDTNIVSELIRNPGGKAYQKVFDVGSTRICTSIIVACELKFGILKRQSYRLSAQVNSVLSTLTVLPLDSPVDERYAEARAQLERRGLPIGNNDLLIAAHALALDLTLVTANVREFRRVEGLRVENWL